MTDPQAKATEQEEQQATEPVEETSEAETPAGEVQAEVVEEEAAADPITELNNKIEALEAEKKELKDQILRDHAELENFKKRKHQETQERLKFASEGLVKEILPSLDNLERALDHAGDPEENEHLKVFIDGIQMVQQHLFEALKKHQIERHSPLGEAFDPNQHEAVGMIASDEYENDQVALVLQPGYSMHNRTIRPAMVQVCKK